MNPAIIQEILNELQDQKIVLETDGCYEVAHDILAARANERRITEDNNRIEATRLVYETEKHQGLLTEKQLNIIEPYIHNLAFAKEDKARLYKFIEDCKRLIENEKAKQETQIRIERELRDTAERNERKATRRKNKARFFAILGTCFAIAAACFFLSERATTLILYNKEAQELLKENRFDQAYKTILKIQSTRDYAPRLITTDSLKKDIDRLKHTLLFHITSGNIKTDSNYLFYTNDSSIIGKTPVNNLPEDNSSFFFNRKFKLSNIGFSTTSDHFYTTEQVETDSSNLSQHVLTLHTIKNNAVADRIVDTLGKASADFDAQGNLIYLKNGAIWCYNITNEKTDSIVNLGIKMAEERPILSFFKMTNEAPLNSSLSDYFQITVKDSVFIFNRKSHTRLSLPATSILDVIENRYLLYCFKDKGLWSPLYRIDLENPGLKAETLRDMANTDPETDFHKLILPFKITGKNPPTVYSNDRKKFIQFDVSNSVFIVNYNNSTNKLVPGPGEQINAFEVLDNMYIYVCEKLNGLQTVYFNDYSFKKKNSFTVPSNWKFVEFRDRKYMLFRLINKNTKAKLQSLLLIAPYMLEDNYLQKWFQN